MNLLLKYKNVNNYQLIYININKLLINKYLIYLFFKYKDNN